jgi:hypothetical protein
VMPADVGVLVPMCKCSGRVVFLRNYLLKIPCCRDCETRYLVRTLVQNLRVGANWRSVIGSLARAVLLESESSRPAKARLDAAAASVVEAFHVCPSLDILVAAMLEPSGVENLDTRISLTPGEPLVWKSFAAPPYYRGSLIFYLWQAMLHHSLVFEPIARC